MYYIYILHDIYYILHAQLKTNQSLKYLLLIRSMSAKAASEF